MCQSRSRHVKREELSANPGGDSRRWTCGVFVALRVPSTPGACLGGRVRIELIRRRGPGSFGVEWFVLDVGAT